MASELVPFVKTGGLADVAGALPSRLQRLGHDARVFCPMYSVLKRGDARFHPVDFATDVPIRLGPHATTFTLWTAEGPSVKAPTYFVDCPPLFHRDDVYTGGPDEALRFGLFSRAILESCQRMGWGPDLIHCNDWHTALVPLLLRTVYDWDNLFRATKTLLTVHNIGYQGAFDAGALGDLGLEAWAHLFDAGDLSRNRINFLRTGLIYADVISTVSPTYAREIQGSDQGMGLEDVLRTRAGRLIGILNGVDYEEWSPELDARIPHRYSRTDLEGKRKNKSALLTRMGMADDTDPPLIGIVSRLVSQKGFELGFEVFPQLLESTPARLVIVGSGESVYERFFQQLRDRYPDRVGFYRGYNDGLAHLVEAGADMFLMPSRYEPCGLNQLFSLRYGTIPVVRRTGGLADSVQMYDPATGEGDGVLFDHFTADGLRWGLGYALRLYRDRAQWSRIVDNAMQRDFSWDSRASRYVELYDWMIQQG